MANNSPVPPTLPVGYKNPPRHSQFKAGKSGNPKGRPKGKIPSSQILAKLLGIKMKINAGGAEKTVMLESGKVNDISTLAVAHKLSEKTIRSTISLAFLAPNIVQATIDGKLSRGLGVSQMTDLPANWAQQRHQLGIS